jgi:ethylbenzene dehydrogenase
MKNLRLNLVLAVIAAITLVNCTHDDAPTGTQVIVDEGVGSSTDELLVKKFSVAPNWDGDIDEVWSEARPLLNAAYVSPAGDKTITLNSSSNGDLSLEPTDLFDPYTGESYKYSLRGGHDGEYLYLLFEWEDDNDSRDRQSWYYDGTKWRQENKYANHDNDKFYEDKFGMMFPIDNPEGFATGTCTVTCHGGLVDAEAGHKATRHYMKNEGELTDFWHWKRDRHALAEAADDGFVQWEDDFGKASANGRKNDSSVSPYSTGMKFTDENTGLNGPKYVIPNRTNYFWITKAEVDNGTAVAVTGVAADGKLTLSNGSVIDPVGDPAYSQGFGNKRMPSVIINAGGGENDPRGEVKVKAKHTGSGWQLEIKRKLETGDPKDASFAPGQSIPFGLAIFNNAAIGHGMSNFLTMTIEE